MEYGTFDITLISASDLRDVRNFGKMMVHARVSVGGGIGMAGTEEMRTPSDKHGKTNPAWNYTMRFAIRAAMVENFNTMLVIKLYCDRNLGDRYIGEVHAPMKELFDYARSGGGSAIVSFPVQRGSVNSQGALRFSYRFGW